MVVRPGPGRGAQAGDGSLGDLFPVQVVLAALGVKENVAGKVTPGNEPRVEHLRYAVGGEHVAVTADDDGGLGGPGVEQEPEAVSDFLGAGRGGTATVGGLARAGAGAPWPARRGRAPARWPPGSAATDGGRGPARDACSTGCSLPRGWPVPPAAGV